MGGRDNGKTRPLRSLQERVMGQRATTERPKAKKEAGARGAGAEGMTLSELFERYKLTPEECAMALPVNVLFGMVNDAMSVFLVQPPIRVTIIRRELRAVFDVIPNECLQNVTLSILKNLSSHFAATFQNSTNDNFVRAAFWHSGLSHFGALFFVHEAGLTAYVGFIYFDVPLKFSLCFLVQGQTESLQHEPCCFLSDLKSAVNFQTAHSVFAIDQHPKSGHPLVERDWRILHYGSNLEGELLFAVIAKPDAASLNERMLRTIAARASHFSIWPAQAHGVIKDALRVGKVNNRFLQCLWFLHALILAYVRLCVKYIITRINGRLWSAKKVHWFFVGIGADQLLHTFQLALTYQFIHSGRLM
jgi:hypothetical protein